MSETPEITRIDYEAVTQDLILVNGYFDGWQDGQQPDTYTSIENCKLLDVLNEARHNGYAIAIFTSKRARAVKGETTRIDFSKTSEGWFVSRYPRGWTGRTQPAMRENKGPDFAIDQALKWLQAHGWDTVEWEGGARAWKGTRMPVRDRDQILKMRKHSNETHNADGYFHYDLAYWF